MKNHSKHNTPFEIILSKEEQVAVANLNSVKNFTKGTFLIKEGELFKNSYFVLRGCVRHYFLIDGEEKTTNFYTENQSILISNPGKSSKSKFYLECIEDTTCSVTTFIQEEAMYKRFPRFQALCRISTEKELGEYQERFATFMISTPEQRYLNLLKNQKDLIQRVPQYQLASYIGVTPESLSRIRKRILHKKKL